MLRNPAAFLCGLLLACAAHAGPLWFADSAGIHRLDTDTNAVTLDIRQRDDVQALVLDQKDGSLWALTSHALSKYDANGAALLQVDLDRLFRGSFTFTARRLALDPGDDSVWIAGGNDAFHLDSTGHVLTDVDLRDGALDIAIAQDESLWVLGRSTISRYSPQGARLGRDDLDGRVDQAQFLAIDDANGTLWLAGQRRVFQAPLALPLQLRATRSMDEIASAIALDAASGTLWVAGQSSLFAFGKDAAALANIDLSRRHLGDFQVLDFDAQSQALWLGHERGLSRFDNAGQFVVTVRASVKVAAIGAAPSGVVPIVTLVSPTNGALTRNAFMPIRVHYDASCFGQPCNFPPGTFAAYVLTATLNGQSIGGAFQFDAATNDAVYTPTARYPEGANSFTAYVTDGSGRRSQPIAAQFTVDTVAPSFVNVTPAGGSVFTAPNITLQGSVDDILASVLLESFSGATFTGPNPAGQSFSYGITLKPGPNSFRLTATDPAGNASTLPLTYVFSSLTLAITSPANGASIDDTKVTVTGTFTGAATATITVNGVAATVSGTTFTAADVPLHFGTNTLTASGTSPDGAHDTKSVTVVSTAPSVAIASPANGATIDAGSVLVRGAIQAVANSGVSVNGVVASVDAANNFLAVVPLAPGANTLTAKVTSPRGASSTQSVTVNASGVAPAIAATAAPLTGMAPLTVVYTVANTTGADATFFFDTSGPFAVPAGATVSLSVTYPEGVFTDSITVNGGAPQAFVISVTSIASLDAMLQALWHNVTGSLAAGDIEGALVYFAPGMRDSYRQALNDIAPALPSMFAAFPPIKATSLAADGDAEYFVSMTRNGKKFGYFLYFMKDGDGIWRLHNL